MAPYPPADMLTGEAKGAMTLAFDKAAEWFFREKANLHPRWSEEKLQRAFLMAYKRQFGSEPPEYALEGPLGRWTGNLSDQEWKQREENQDEDFRSKEIGKG